MIHDSSDLSSKKCHTHRKCRSFAHNTLKRSLPKQTTHMTGEKKRHLRYLPPMLVLFPVIIVLSFGIHFVIFSEKIWQLKPPNPLPQADAIIVFTGGENRIETGLNLLQQGIGSRLLISGVNIKTNPKRFMRTTHIKPQLFACCVDIGYQAINTEGNAKESADWIRKNNYKTLYIVTHDYHMQRSLLELKHLMPNINFIAYPVKKHVSENTIQQINQIRILVYEYIKTIWLHIRIIF